MSRRMQVQDALVDNAWGRIIGRRGLPAAWNDATHGGLRAVAGG